MNRQRHFGGLVLVLRLPTPPPYWLAIAITLVVQPSFPKKGRPIFVERPLKYDEHIRFWGVNTAFRLPTNP